MYVPVSENNPHFLNYFTMEEESPNRLALGFFIGAVTMLFAGWFWNNHKNFVPKKSISEMSKIELQDVLKTFIKEEKYEEAAMVRDLIAKL